MAGSRQEILAATTTVLSRVGPVKLTLELVAAELSISKQALYYYFPSRAALLSELAIDALFESATAVHRACSAAKDGASSLDALIRTYVGYFLPRLDLHHLITILGPVTDDLRPTPEQLAKIRPLNDLMYGETEKRLAAEARGKRRASARRLAFTAYLAAMGMLTMRAMVQKIEDPLIHSDDSLVDELCRTFRAAAAENARAH